MTHRNKLSSAWDRVSHTAKDWVADGNGATMAANGEMMAEASRRQVLVPLWPSLSGSLHEWRPIYGMGARRRVGHGRVLFGVRPLHLSYNYSKVCK